MTSSNTLKTFAIKTKIGAIWGIAGITLLLGSATVRLFPLFLESFKHPYAWYHWLSLPVFTLLMIYYEGIKGFQRAFSPRVAARAKHLTEHPTLLHILLAPLFCMGFFHTTRKRQTISIVLTCSIIVLIILTAQLAQPWRGIVDAGVVAGLAWGAAATLYFSWLAFFTPDFKHNPELPPELPAQAN